MRSLPPTVILIFMGLSLVSGNGCRRRGIPAGAGPVRAGNSLRGQVGLLRAALGGVRLMLTDPRSQASSSGAKSSDSMVVLTFRVSSTLPPSINDTFSITSSASAKNSGSMCSRRL